MNSALLWIGGLLVAVLCALFAVPHFIDWDRWRGVFEEEASRALGREIRVDGRVSIRLLPAPFVQFDKVSVADAQGVIGEPLFRADSFTLWLAVSPLLKGAVEAQEIALRRPVLNLRFADDGGGNWQTLRLAPGALPYVPSEFALKSVKIVDGIIAIRGQGERELARIEAITGEVSASALDGPYRFRLDGSWGGESREVRGATARQEADGSVRLKMAVRAPKSGSTYTVDGRLVDLAGRSRLEGELTAKLPLGIEPAAATGRPGVKAGGDRAVYDMKARLAADTAGARLSDIVLSFEQDGRPQLVTGAGEVGWRSGLRIDTELSSRWLDLDRIAGVASANPPDALRRLVGALVDLLPAEGRVKAGMKVDQVNFGGDLASAVRLSLERPEPGPIRLRELVAGLPGNARLELSGQLSGRGDTASFDGDLRLAGANLTRFLGWAARGYAVPEARGDGTFGLRGRLMATPGAIELKDAQAEIGRTAVAGGLSYRSEAGGVLALSLDGALIDLAALAPGALDVAGLRRFVWPDSATTVAAGPQQPFLLERMARDVQLRVKALRITDGTRRFRDLDADLSLAGDVLKIAALRFASEGGDLEFALEGQIARDGTRRKGQLEGFVAADTREALVELVDLMDWPAALKAETALPTSLLPLRLGFTTGNGRRADLAVDLTVDGTAAGNRVAGNVRLDGGIAGWATAPIAASLTVDSPSLGSIAGLLLPKAEIASRGESGDVPGRLTLSSSGATAEDLVAFARLETDDDRVSYAGRAAVTRDGITRLAGEATAEIGDLGRMLGAGHLRRRPAAMGIAVSGVADIAFADKRLRIGARDLGIGGAPVTGSIEVSQPKDRLRVDARLATPHARLPALLAIVLDRRAPRSASSPALAAKDAGEIALGAGSVWPDLPFDFTPLDGLEGRVALTAGQLSLDAGVGLSDAVLEADLAPDRITISRLEGKALGGKATATAVLEKAASGASLTATLAMTGARVDALAIGRPGSAMGGAALQMQASGRALGPRSMIASLSGRGEVELQGVRLANLSPAALTATAEAVLAGKSETSGAGLRGTLTASLAQGALPVGTRKLPFEIADGVVKVRAFAVEGADGRVSNQTTVELGSLRVDSEWRIEAPADRKPAAGNAKPALPGITVVHVGRLGALARIEPRLSFDALERELVVRKMERDVEELERTRKLDEERARVEAERRLETERRKAEADRLRLEAERAWRPLEGAPGSVLPKPADAAPASEQPKPAAPSATTGALPAAGTSATAGPVPGPQPSAASGAVAPSAGSGVADPKPELPAETIRRPASSGRSGLTQSPSPQSGQEKFNPFNRTTATP